MGWQSEYTKLLKERLNFRDFSLNVNAEEVTPKMVADNFQNRMSVLKHAASEGDKTAKAMYLLLCEDFLRAMQNEYKSSRPYLVAHESLVSSLDNF